MKNIHVLLVEDNEGDIILTRDALEQSKTKTKISVVKNGSQALDFLFKRGEFKNAERPDLIFLDIDIPIYNGHEVMKQIKENVSLNKIPVVMLTTYWNPGNIRLAYKNEANSYLTKPVGINEITLIISKWINFNFNCPSCQIDFSG